MNYTENNKKSKKSSNYFYIIIGCCILILGGAAWFALSNIGENAPKSEYPNNNSSYIDSVPELSVPESPIEPTTESESEVPYEAPAVDSPKSNAVSFKMAVEGDVVKDFSDKALVFSKTFGDMRLHLGTDIACPLGTAVSAVMDGSVQSVEQDVNLGNVIIINHGDYTVKYAALDTVKVKAGDTVQMGDILGTTGTVVSECEDAPHLHLEAYKDNKPVSILKAFEIE